MLVPGETFNFLPVEFNQNSLVAIDSQKRKRREETEINEKTTKAFESVKKSYSFKAGFFVDISDEHRFRKCFRQTVPRSAVPSPCLSIIVDYLKMRKSNMITAQDWDELPFLKNKRIEVLPKDAEISDLFKLRLHYTYRDKDGRFVSVGNTCILMFFPHTFRFMKTNQTAPVTTQNLAVLAKDHFESPTLEHLTNNLHIHRMADEPYTYYHMSPWTDDQRRYEPWMIVKPTVDTLLPEESLDAWHEAWMHVRKELSMQPLTRLQLISHFLFEKVMFHQTELDFSCFFSPVRDAAPKYKITDPDEPPFINLEKYPKTRIHYGLKKGFITHLKENNHKGTNVRGSIFG